MEVALVIIKIASILLLFLVSILLGILPAKSNLFRSNPKLIAFMNSFSAGLFLGLGMIHLLPESLTDYNEYLDFGVAGEKTFPVPFVICIISFSTVLFIERVLFQAHTFFHLHAGEHHDELDRREKKGSASSEDLQEAFILSPTGPVFGPMGLECDEEKEEETFKKLISTKEKVARTTIDKEFHKKVKISETHSSGSKHSHKNVVGPYALLTALSIHGMFEGVAVGIQNNSTQALNLTMAVLLHKWAEALTLGLALFKGKLSYKVILFQVFLFSLSAPIGIGIGWAISSSSLLVSSIFKAISAGTFLYVAATELIVEEFSISTNMYPKFGIYVIALIMMGALAQFE